MHLRRHIAATWILATFCAGMVVAPISHYAFMAWCDAIYAPVHVGHAAVDPHAAHRGNSAAFPTVTSPKDEVVHCSYWDVFATFAAVSQPASTVLPAPAPSARLDVAPAQEPTPVGPSTDHVRGPPSA
jgi:hypothetical protein